MDPLQADLQQAGCRDYPVFCKPRVTVPMQRLIRLKKWVQILHMRGTNGDQRPKIACLRKSGQLPISVDPSMADNLQTQIFRAIQKLIIGGQLKAGMILPSIREMAAQLGVSKNTVILSYERLNCEGYLVTERGVGSYVSPHLPEQALRVSQHSPTRKEKKDLLARRHPVLFHGHLHGIFSDPQNQPYCNFVPGRPEPSTFPTRTWKRLISQKLEHGQQALTQYREPQGLRALRVAIADHLGPARGIVADPDQIIITGGIQEALTLVARALVASETRVAIENPCYQGADYVFNAARAEIVEVPVDDEGLETRHLPVDPVSLIYVTPSHQYPLGATLSLKRRFELLEWAWHSGAYIVEDDYDSDFHYRGSPLSALAGLDQHESVIYLGTFSKSIGPGIRTGYMVAPWALVAPLKALKGLMNNGNPWLEQAVLATFISEGGFARHLRKTLQLYAERQTALIDALTRYFDSANVTGAGSGMHLLWTMPEGRMTATELARRALQKGIGIYPLASSATPFATADPRHDRMLMLGFPSVSSTLIRKAVKSLAHILAQPEMETAPRR